MRYVRIPKEVHTSDLLADEACFSPGRYVRFIPSSKRRESSYVPLDRVVVVRDEVVSAKKGELYRYAEIGDINVATGGVTFRELPGYRLPTPRPSRAEFGDVLVSTVRTYRKGIGLVTDNSADLVTSGAILNFKATKDLPSGAGLPYVYAFLRSDFFVEQVWALLHRGVYPRMDTGALGKIILPVADDADARKYISALAVAIAEKERAIRERNREINHEIKRELRENSIGARFVYQLPTISDLRGSARLDASVYSRELSEAMHLIKSYRFGWANYRQLGFSIGRGQNLQVSCIGHSIYSDSPRDNFYRLVAPTDISEFRTVEAFRYLGSKRNLELLKKGDVVFGAEGFCKGRSVILVDDQERTISNIHGVVFHPKDGSMTRGIFFGCFLGYLREVGVIDAIGAGGSGGSLAIGYLDQVPFPRFPDDVQIRIARLYHNNVPAPRKVGSVEDFVEQHRRWNESLGIWELDREMKLLQRRLSMAQEEVIEGRVVEVDLSLERKPDELEMRTSACV